MNFDFGFTGHFLHQTSGLYLTLSRPYNPTFGRWMSRDPLDNAEMTQRANLYWYGGNDPINSIDPLGLTTIWSPTPFPGAQGGNGYYSRTMDDGSSLLKQLLPLDDDALRKSESATYCLLQSDDAPGEAFFDTPYWNHYNPDLNEYYLYKGMVFANYEVNYYGIGMYEAAAGDPWGVAVGLTYGWKLLWYQQTPNPNTLYWLAKGYYDYQYMHGQ
jgi:RHS repeat-associated protein